MSDSVKEAVDSYEYGGIVGLIKIGDTMKSFTCELKEDFDIENLKDTFSNFGIHLTVGFRND